jgi:hypothetical protein
VSKIGNYLVDKQETVGHLDDEQSSQIEHINAYLAVACALAERLGKEAAIEYYMTVASGLAARFEKEHGLTVLFGREGGSESSQPPTCRVINSEGAML